MKLHTYQELARDFLRQHSEAGLFLDCGYGKTAITLSAFERHHLPALVVAPKRPALHTWPAEHQLWRPELELALAIGGPAERRAALDLEAEITVIGRDNLKDIKRPYRTVVFDELSGYKDKGTERWKMGRRLAKAAKTVWGLTGTPMPNGLLDLWAQLYLLDGGQRLDTAVTRYRERYFLPAKILKNPYRVVAWKPKPGAEDAIHRKIDDICLSIVDEIELPPITYNRIYVDLPSSVRSAYREFQRELLVNLELLGGEVHTAANAAVLTGKLSQLTAGFLYSDDGTHRYDWLHDAKLDALAEVRDGTGDNLLVFYRFQAELEALRRRFPEAWHLDDAGAITAWNQREVPMLFAHPQSAAHGLNLQHGGHSIVWNSLDWSLEIWIQANARLFRQGQKNPVVVHMIEVEGSIDTVIDKRIHSKKFDQDALINHLASPL
jgi:SNF2 family DNA or RNA helicase